MRNPRKAIQLLTMLTVALLLMIIGGCKKDSPARETTYNMIVKDILGVSGTVTFTEMNSATTIIEIELVNAPSETHPAYLCRNSMIEDGTVVVALNPVDETGKSSTTVTSLTYNQLIAYDGFIKVLAKNTEPNVILAQGDIGGNVMTTISKAYPLSAIGAYGVSGAVLFKERLNGNTLVVITLIGTIADEIYPATINLGTIASVGGGPVMKLLNSVDGSTGESYTNIRKLESGIDITYDNWLVYDGYVNIYQAPVSLDNVICQGNIGSHQ